MKKRIAILIGAGTALMATAAVGGFVSPVPVEVDLVARGALGDQVTARYSKNNIELIGCGIRLQQDGLGGVFAFGFCQANDRGGEAITCITEDAALLDAISSSGEFGFITFGWNEDDECTRIGFSNQSFYLPKKLDSNE